MLIGMMWPIYLINLDRAPDRLAQSGARLEADGLAFRRVTAIDGQALGGDVRSAPRPPFAKQATTPGEIACHLSHHKVWSMIADSQESVAVVLEDDFVLIPDAVRLLALLSHMPHTWDMLKLDCNRPRKLLESNAIAGGYRIGTPDVIPPTTIAYAITREAARVLSRAPPVTAWPVDLYLKRWWEHGLSIKVLEPGIARPADGHSLTSAIAHDRAKVRRNALWRFLRNIAYQIDFRYQMHRHAGRRALSSSLLQPAAERHGER